VIDVLENKEVRQTVVKVTPDAYERMAELGLISEKTELIDGVIIEKMSKSPRHVAILRKLQSLLTPLITKNEFLNIEQPLRIAKSEPEPDISITANASDFYRHGHPETAELVIEIAQSSLALDREKIAIYAAANVRRYLIVNLQDNCVEEYSNPQAGKYISNVFLRSDETLKLHAGVEINVAEILL
jgi:Uma2 family endonuclease